MVVGRIKLLLIEDDEDDAFILIETLKEVSPNFIIDHVDRLAKAAEYLMENDVDIILSDLSLPDCRGIDTVRNVIDMSGGKVPVIVLTGFSDDEMGEKSIQVGADDYLIKNEVSGSIVSRVIRYTLERHKIKHKLKETNKLLSDFCHTVAHDLKNPLNSFGLFVGLVQEDLDPSENGELIDMSEVIEQSVSRMAQILDDLLLFAESGGDPLDKEVINVKELIFNKVLVDLGQRINTSNAIIDVGELKNIFFSQTHLYQVFQNLISNALKFMPKDVIPSVSIYAKSEEYYDCVCVKDNGIGIAPEYLGSIFKPFQRLHRVDQYPGTGIGLATISKILDNYNSEISCESIIGEGSIFTVKFPRLKLEEKALT